MKRALLMIVIVILIGCDGASGGGKGQSTTPNITNRVITPVNQESENIVETIELYLDDLTFEEAFGIEYRAKGEGHTFWWRSDEYTTDLYVLNGNYKWVRNSDDADDACYSNEWDECGICNGLGKITWYKDLDGDGLGDPTNYTKTCIYPSVDEE